jgi:hypothetical protein
MLSSMAESTPLGTTAARWAFKLKIIVNIINNYVLGSCQYRTKPMSWVLPGAGPDRFGSCRCRTQWMSWVLSPEGNKYPWVLLVQYQTYTAWWLSLHYKYTKIKIIFSPMYGFKKLTNLILLLIWYILLFVFWILLSFFIIVNHLKKTIIIVSTLVKQVSYYY